MYTNIISHLNIKTKIKINFLSVYLCFHKESVQSAQKPYRLFGKNVDANMRPLRKVRNAVTMASSEFDEQTMNLNY